MAKPHRMAVMTVACLLAAAELGGGRAPWGLALGLGVVSAGCVLTLARRIATVARGLRAAGPGHAWLPRISSPRRPEVGHDPDA
jgi:hypothetical protein